MAIYEGYRQFNPPINSVNLNIVKQEWEQSVAHTCILCGKKTTAMWVCNEDERKYACMGCQDILNGKMHEVNQRNGARDIILNG